jgi:hypothetical protein
MHRGTLLCRLVDGGKEAVIECKSILEMLDNLMRRSAGAALNSSEDPRSARPPASQTEESTMPKTEQTGGRWIKARPDDEVEEFIDALLASGRSGNAVASVLMHRGALLCRRVNGEKEALVACREIMDMLQSDGLDIAMPCPVVTTSCVDCGIGTITTEEWYMVKDEVWEQVWCGRRKSWHQMPGTEILCIGCLEQRLGRTLTATDFADAPINDPNEIRMSKRLRERLATTKCEPSQNEKPHDAGHPETEETMPTAIPDFLQTHAAKFELIVTADAGHKEGLDVGPFLLRCRQTGRLFWPHGLPVEGIADALNCFERELWFTRDLDPKDEARWNAALSQAWGDFGESWQHPSQNPD